MVDSGRGVHSQRITGSLTGLEACSVSIAGEGGWLVAYPDAWPASGPGGFISARMPHAEALF